MHFPSLPISNKNQPLTVSIPSSKRALSPNATGTSSYASQTKKGKLQSSVNAKSSAPNNNQQNNQPNSHNIYRRHNNNQKALKSFDSSDPDKPNSEFIESNDGFRTVIPRSKKRTSINAYLKSIGTGEIMGLKTCERLVPVYLGRIDIDESNENVENFVKKITKIYNFSQIQLPHSYFKSFKFSIGISNVEIIKKKELWPKGVVISRYGNPKSPLNVQSSQSSVNSNTKSLAEIKQIVLNNQSNESSSMDTNQLNQQSTQ